MRVLGAQLQGGPRASAGARIGEADWLERSEPWRIRSLAGYLLDRLACLEQFARFEILCDNAAGCHELGDEPFVLVFRERRVQVVARTFVLIAALTEQDVSVQRVCHHDGGGGVVEGKRFGAGRLLQRGGKGIRGKRAACNDKRVGSGGKGACCGRFLWPTAFVADEQGAVVADAHDLCADDLNVAKACDGFLDSAREALTVDRERPACWHSARKRGVEQERSERCKLAFQHSCGAVGLLAFERVRADKLGERTACMDRRRRIRAHFDQAHADAACCQLKCRLASCQSAAYDVDALSCQRLHAVPFSLKIRAAIVAHCRESCGRGRTQREPTAVSLPFASAFQAHGSAVLPRAGWLDASRLRSKRCMRGARVENVQGLLESAQKFDATGGKAAFLRCRQVGTALRARSAGDARVHPPLSRSAQRE